MGPLYKLPFIQRRYRQKEGGDKYTEEQSQVEGEKEKEGEKVEEGDKWYVELLDNLKLIVAFCLLGNVSHLKRLSFFHATATNNIIIDYIFH